MRLLLFVVSPHRNECFSVILTNIKISPVSHLIEDYRPHLQSPFSRIAGKPNNKQGQQFCKSKSKNVRTRIDLRHAAPLPFKDHSKSETQRGYLGRLRSHSPTDGCESVTQSNVQSHWESFS